MKSIVRIIAFILVISALLSTASCGSYQGATGVQGGGSGGGSGSGGNEGGSQQPTLDGDPTNDFTVTLTLLGESYTPRMDMSVYWSDGFSMFSAPVNKQGVARIDGLDGDYRVTLSAIPNELCYDPNSHIATNDDRNITVELYPLNRLSGRGKTFYDAYSFNVTGVYSAVIEKPGDKIFFHFTPKTNGVYTVESWCDVTKDDVDPDIDIYTRNTHWENYESTITEGGKMGSYTINFLYTDTIADENISSAGSVPYIFAITAESKSESYPITVTFAVKRDGEFESPPSASVAKSVAVPEFDFSGFNKADHNYGADYTLTSPAYALEGKANTYVFDDRIYKIYEIKRELILTSGGEAVSASEYSVALDKKGIAATAVINGRSYRLYKQTEDGALDGVYFTTPEPADGTLTVSISTEEGRVILGGTELDCLFRVEGDGFYHLFDEELYADNNGYGPILYAYITSACPFLDSPFTRIEYWGDSLVNNALTAKQINYKHFIEGYTALSTYGCASNAGHTYYCVASCPCHKYVAEDESTHYGWACTEACDSCDASCNRIPEALVNNEGYQAYANDDGMVPVTAELQKFLSDFCMQRQYFYDGKGHVDGSAWEGSFYQAVGDSGWLFACAYYKK